MSGTEICGVLICALIGAARLGLTNEDADFIIAYAKQREATK